MRWRKCPLEKQLAWILQFCHRHATTCKDNSSNSTIVWSIMSILKFTLHFNCIHSMDFHGPVWCPDCTWLPTRHGTRHLGAPTLRELGRVIVLTPPSQPWRTSSGSSGRYRTDSLVEGQPLGFHGFSWKMVNLYQVILWIWMAGKWCKWHCYTMLYPIID